ncbi:hypothetical protein SBA4_1000010 [Candidatus Sulfopaludibacter sp. SbA4]|nr:hypothetical protein SBA4_1000010 [Candidatus Sulfopaludibacter sp. SbA4]
MAGRRRFRIGTAQASFSKAGARDLSSGAPVPEAPAVPVHEVRGELVRPFWNGHPWRARH